MLSDVDPEVIRTVRENWYAGLEYTPKLGQALVDRAVDAGKRHIGFFTPPQEGKSYHIAKLLGALLAIPGTQAWVIAPTYLDGSKEFGYVYGDLAQMGLLRTAKAKHFDVRGGNMRVELKHGSWLTVVSAQDQENLRREQLDVVVYAEASKLPENLHDRFVYSRVEKRRGKVFYPTTHKGYGWVYTDIRCRGLKLKDRTWTWGPWKAVEGGKVRDKIGGEPNPDYDPEYWSVQVSYFPDYGEVLQEAYSAEQIAKAKARLLPQFFSEQFGGEAASYAGLIYPFDPRHHECEPFPVPDTWTHVVGYDHGAGGGSDPTAIIFGSYAPDGTLYVWGELYERAQRSIAAHATALRLRLGRKVPSHIMRGRDAKQVGYELMQAGLSNMFPQETAVTARIVRVGQLFQTRKLKLFRGMTPELKREVLNYEWDERRPGEPREHQSDHALDALGYLSLAPVTLPFGPMLGETPVAPVSLRERLMAERLWGTHIESRDEGIRRDEYQRLAAILEPDPLDELTAVEDWVA